ncbi:Cwp1p SKDI_11G1190 [Saccharomyces kudriavzevii IFO 1802]|uniref:Uncharacterized protein n=2 Tax=Saccharomyces kudriavzevii (strain ATCC MYA-4449 / AS 2.2408 / CBS 8840 / NBRC 1802 / NCYC 2889) TaxID=226230 RepID=A0AA35NHW8_SACK1|nr:uncharacterized protein SKDI_11G1190 [Saccharomyces kudriavzevii IFO 1802]EJT41961.1 CWP1-like protein [Saccharomyces kudriavzevii IFO 1802]CAI4044678.1 hypothetical protein SKDI_11G1190 [Saccharomyces kudriavzevii IFO 1802]
MKFSTSLSVALFALAKTAIADSEEFGLVSIRSGSDLQYLSVYSDDGTLKLGSGSSSSSSSSSFGATITDDGKLKFDDGKYAVVDNDGSLKEGSESDAATGFSIKDGHLNYKSSDGFYAIKKDSSYIFSSKQSDDATGIAIRPTSKTGSVVPDFAPSDSPSGSSAAQSASSTESSRTSHTTLVSSASSAVASVISQITDGQVQAPNTVYEQTENGAVKAAAGMGAGALAAAAALLL